MIEAVVLGVSAGGLTALSTLLPALTPDYKNALVIVQHLQDSRPSALVSILRPKCRIPLKEADMGEHLLGGTIYLAPPGYHLLIEASRTFSLSEDRPVNFARPSIDVLFESAADVFEDRVAGVILTGANSDGATGLAAIKKAGGITIVQDPDTAESPVMPRAAIRATKVDHLLGLTEIASLLCAMSNLHDGLGPVDLRI